MIDASKRMIDVQSKVTGEPKDGWGINPVMKKHLELEIKTLQNVPKDAAKTTFGNKAKTKERSYAHERHIKVSYRN
jgi:hypothetical protein